MFSFFKKQKIVVDNDLYSPIQGEFLNLEEVSDPVFSEKTMGDGFAIQPDGDELLVSPVAGEVMMVAATKHAIGIHMANGLDVLLHLGLDTVNMDGSPFNINIKVGDIVSARQHLGTMDLEKIISAGYDTTIMVVITNMNMLKTLSTNDGRYQAGDKVGVVTVK
ncbi:PTS glucose transporter subunit IIA [Leuconostoc gasicomitatum]|uniref:PTS sugar transporter subunit IIA n=1 Tax=Leuconostoc gasicomitatum TaxID=115778 RepID=UPI001CC4BA50|nr:PTS glucose transporter subunit IIA [Leuconostoc gasicomitatum]MBZ5968789.1 PTS glucose transporter subunit IIA [Leuconostoc gasicomitatum]MBZ5997075.1 PTS glucose transporter subunit IIA [Leuconostoc gasicomitatum]